MADDPITRLPFQSAIEASVDEAMRRAVRNTLAPGALVLGLVYGTLAPAHFLFVQKPEALPLALLAAATSVLCLALSAVWHRRPPPLARAHQLLALLAAAVFVNSTLHLALLEEPRQTTNLALLALGSGFLFLSRAWYVAVLCAAIGAWAMIAALAPPSPDWGHFGFLLIGASAVGVATHTARVRTLRELELARLESDRSRRRTEEHHRSVIETAGSVIVSLDLDRRVDDWNPAAERLTGWKREEIRENDVLEVALPPEVREPVAETLREVLSGVPKTGLASPIWTRDGERRIVLWNLSRLCDATGEPSGVVAVGQDITGREQSARSLAEKTGELERANRELEAFTSAAAHDLVEPLRKLVSFSELLPDDLGSDLPEKAAQDLGFIREAAYRMQDLVRDLLAFSRAGSAPLHREQLSVDTCVDRALEGLTLVAAETHASLTRDPLPELDADAALLTTIYQNLVSNALKFSGSRRPRVHVSAERSKGRWILGVRDRGIGVPAESAHEIFEPFQRLHARDRYPGTGLGLAICRTAVERHGGRIWVESEPGQGAHFRFTLGA